MPARKEAKKQPSTLYLRPVALGLIAAFVATALYSPALQYGWVWDDQFLVQSHGAGGVGAEGFRPLVSLLYRLEWTLGLGTPLIPHLTSILLHGVATWLFFWLALNVGASPASAFVGGLIFASHPVHVEAVAYVSGRPDLLATVFAMAALLLARSGDLVLSGGCRSWKIWPAYAAMVAAVLCDEVAMVTPFLLVGLDRFGSPRVPWRRRLTHYSGFFAIALAYLLARYAAGGGVPGAMGTAQSASGIQAAARGWAAPMALFEYIRILVLPHPLNALRTLTAPEAAATWNRVAPFVALAGLALFVAWRRRDPATRVGALLLLLPLVPALPLPHFLGSYAEERAAYFASVGICLLIASIHPRLAAAQPKIRRLVGSLAIAIAVLLGLSTLVRIPVWRENVTLLQAAAAAAPNDPTPHLTLVEHYASDGNWELAVLEIQRALAIDPTLHDAVARQTEILSRLGRVKESELSARRAIELDPRDAVSYSNLSDALIQQGKAAEGVGASRRAVEIDSTISGGWYNYGVALAAFGDTPAAVGAYERAIALEPNNVLALNNLGAILGSTGRLPEARDLYLRLVGLAPNSIEARMNLALAYLRLGDREGAARERDTVRRLNPSAVRQLDEIFRQHVAEARDNSPGGTR